MAIEYPNTNLYIDGKWRPAVTGDTLDVINPATEEVIGQVARAQHADLDEALEAADKAFASWKKTTPLDRYRILRKAADLLRERASMIAEVMTTEQGKPLAEAKGETLMGADRIDWMAEEGRRAYGRVIPARSDGVYQFTVKEPVGPVAAFTPWNFPLNQILQKVPAAIAAGCSIIVKGPEEAPACCAELVKVFEDAGLPAGVLNLVFGIPAEISDYLIPHPIIKKVTFTGSTAVGKQLAAKAGEHMKLVTMELGGHSPAIVFEDADVDTALNILSANKFRNAGQVCVSPTRFLVHESLYNQFVDGFTKISQNQVVGNGLDTSTTMGPLAHDRRVDAIESFVLDAVDKGAKVKTGGQRKGNKGYFYEPTVLTDVPLNSRIMNEEPFGPIAPITPFSNFDDVVQEANRLPYGLAAYAYTTSAKTAGAIGSALSSGMVSINHHGLAMPETPFGGIGDSGFGKEGGMEGIESYLHTKFITQADV
ncbi:MAG: NAD-dependent succinate-semialdehyde dehydrogenase [Alphaproteobacteria bacterium]|nr:NAD-dependent succinate-semialdehyde dehydrogenase [Alphaproteobacteria bacterium]MDG1886319.1 NAD-dependent succinate-semialdehyde dehydrogenase [Alphaproteobacteria bacterium]